MKTKTKTSTIEAAKAEMEHCLERYQELYRQHPSDSYYLSCAYLYLQQFRGLKLRLPDNNSLVAEIEATYTALQKELLDIRCSPMR